jgi:hypothetical protein
MTIVLELFCLRCDRPFKTSHLTDLCAPCAYAGRPDQVMGTVTATGYLVIALDGNRKPTPARVDARPPFKHGAEVAVKIGVSLPISVVNAAVANAAAGVPESAVIQPDVVGEVAS